MFAFAEKKKEKTKSATKKSTDQFHINEKHSSNNTMQFVPWTPANVTPAANLSQQLHAGYLFAQANPVAKPARPAWVLTRVEQDRPWDQVAERRYSDTLAIIRWNKLVAPPNPAVSPATATVAFLAANAAPNLPAILPAAATGASSHIENPVLWRQAISNQDYDNRHNVHTAQWTTTANARWTNEAKWNHVWANTAGDLPAHHTYREYYAESSGAIDAEGFWGRNRIIRENGGVGAYANNWWASDDHYTNFTRVT